MTIAALIVAAGRGTRAAATGGQPKQYAALRGKPMLAHTIECFEEHPDIATITVAIHPDDHAAYMDCVAHVASSKLTPPVNGGATRQVSVLNGLEAIEKRIPGVKNVLIHDAARPFISASIIQSVLAALEDGDGAIPALPVADTLKRTGGETHKIIETLPRSGLWRAQTPQGFRFAAILDAHRRAAAHQRQDFTDDAAIAEWAGLSVVITPGSRENEKITTAEDLALANDKLAAQQAYETRTGTGFDVHRFAPGSSVWLCGVEIPHDQRLEGHSDADVGLHALTDAILGALADGDIGAHFPPSDPKWKGAASHVFLKDAARRLADRGGRFVNVDVTLLCEAPKVGPHRDAMRAAIAEILEIETSRVGVKATTTEGLGFTGRREGIAAMASASVLLPVEQSTKNAPDR